MCVHVSVWMGVYNDKNVCVLCVYVCVWMGVYNNMNVCVWMGV